MHYEALTRPQIALCLLVLTQNGWLGHFDCVNLKMYLKSVNIKNCSQEKKKSAWLFGQNYFLQYTTMFEQGKNSVSHVICVARIARSYYATKQCRDFVLLLSMSAATEVDCPCIIKAAIAGILKWHTCLGPWNIPGVSVLFSSLWKRQIELCAYKCDLLVHIYFLAFTSESRSCQCKSSSRHVSL